MARRLMRSRSEKIIGGVCGGMAEYFNVDPILVRAIAVVFALMAFAGVILYVVLWAVLPLTPPPPPAAN
jgi:phage shock protein C